VQKVHLQKLLVNKFPAFYGTQNLITVFTEAPMDLILNHLNSVHTLTSYFFENHFNITFSSTPLSPK